MRKTYDEAELKIMELLSDGVSHPAKELIEILKDCGNGDSRLANVLASIRKERLRPGMLLLPIAKGKRVEYMICRHLRSSKK